MPPLIVASQKSIARGWGEYSVYEVISGNGKDERSGESHGVNIGTTFQRTALRPTLEPDVKGDQSENRHKPKVLLIVVQCFTDSKGKTTHWQGGVDGIGCSSLFAMPLMNNPKICAIGRRFA